VEETLLALSLGLSGGISPGPMLVLVLTQTIQYGLKEGLKVTLGPLISDAPIIIAAYYFTNQIPVNLLDWLYLPGGLYLIYIAKHSWAIDFDSMDVQKPVANSIRKGVVTNVLNPAPYLFWLTIGAPIIIKMQSASKMGMFFLAFYAALLGTKVLIAYLISVGRNNQNALKYISKTLAVIIWGYGFYFLFLWVKMIWEGLGLPY
tara:strand:+ start:13435 stop:14046 length:612 start_codon:yes stop_codon:yes gene_type:complete